MFMFFLQFSQAEEQYDVGQVGIFTMISFAKVCLLLFISNCQAPETIYRVAGASDDWARGEAGIK